MYLGPDRCAYVYRKPSMSRRYAKVLQYVANHAGCKRVDIIEHVWTERSWDFTNDITYMRGYCSCLFGHLVADKLIAYNKKYEYHITKRGMKILKNAYLNDMAKFVMNPNYQNLRILV